MNKIRLDGYNAIATSNWKQLKWVAVSWSLDKIDSVAVLSLVASNWSQPTNIFCYLESDLQKKAKQILLRRFGHVQWLSTPEYYPNLSSNLFNTGKWESLMDYPYISFFSTKHSIKTTQLKCAIPASAEVWLISGLLLISAASMWLLTWTIIFLLLLLG